MTIGTSGLTDTTTFVNNNITNGVYWCDGGAIYNEGTLVSYKGVTFLGNYGVNGGSRAEVQYIIPAEMLLWTKIYLNIMVIVIIMGLVHPRLVFSRRCYCQ